MASRSSRMASRSSRMASRSSRMASRSSRMASRSSRMASRSSRMASRSSRMAFGSSRMAFGSSQWRSGVPQWRSGVPGLQFRGGGGAIVCTVRVHEPSDTNPVNPSGTTIFLSELAGAAAADGGVLADDARGCRGGWGGVPAFGKLGAVHGECRGTWRERERGHAGQSHFAVYDRGGAGLSVSV